MTDFVSRLHAEEDVREEGVRSDGAVERDDTGQEGPEHHQDVDVPAERTSPDHRGCWVMKFLHFTELEKILRDSGPDVRFHFSMIQGCDDLYNNIIYIYILYCSYSVFLVQNLWLVPVILT